jgi:hypothetical protein
MRSKAELGESKQGSASCSRLIFLVDAARHDHQGIIRQRPLQRLRLVPGCAQKSVTLNLIPPFGSTLSGPHDIQQDVDVATVRLNYRFGSPVVAKY